MATQPEDCGGAGRRGAGTANGPPERRRSWVLSNACGLSRRENEIPNSQNSRLGSRGAKLPRAESAFRDRVWPQSEARFGRFSSSRLPLCLSVIHDLIAQTTDGGPHNVIFQTRPLPSSECFSRVSNRASLETNKITTCASLMALKNKAFPRPLCL